MDDIAQLGHLFVYTVQSRRRSSTTPAHSIRWSGLAPIAPACVSR